MRYVFADFYLDMDRCLLTRGRKVVSLRPKSFDLLAILVERAGSVVGKDALLDVLWPHVTVQENSLTQCVADLRRCLGDDGGRLIQTVPKRGYMLDAAVRTDNLYRPVTMWVRPMAGFVLGLVVAILMVALWPPGVEGSSSSPPQSRELLQTRTTILDQPLAWPTGSPRLVSGTTVLAPGEASQWHRHEAPLFAYILSGEIIIDYGTFGERRYSAGEAIVEALDHPHQARNEGPDWAEILYILIGSDDTSVRTPSPVSGNR